MSAYFTFNSFLYPVRLIANPETFIYPEPRADLVGSVTWNFEEGIWDASQDILSKGGGRYKNNLVVISKDKIYIGEDNNSTESFSFEPIPILNTYNLYGLYYFQVAGDQRFLFNGVSQITISDSSENDGTWNLDSTVPLYYWYEEGFGTAIFVDSAISEIADGYINII
jgi:hypothetical protein